MILSRTLTSALDLEVAESFLCAMQNGRIGRCYETGGNESKSISSELASAIDEGLYYYEQVESNSCILVFYC